MVDCEHFLSCLRQNRSADATFNRRAQLSCEIAEEYRPINCFIILRGSYVVPRDPSNEVAVGKDKTTLGTGVGDGLAIGM